MLSLHSKNFAPLFKKTAIEIATETMTTLPSVVCRSQQAIFLASNSASRLALALAFAMQTTGIFA